MTAGAEPGARGKRSDRPTHPKGLLMNPHGIFELLLSSSRHRLGVVVPARNPVTSKIEQRVRRRLLAAGLSVEQGWAIQCGLEPFSEKFPVLTPDFIIKDTTVCVEVDPLDTRGRRVLQDGMRNALFTPVGWTIIRLRLGGQRPLGGYEVVTDGEPITEDVITSLLAAVAAAVAGRPGTAHRGSSGPGLSLPRGGAALLHRATGRACARALDLQPRRTRDHHRHRCP